MSPLDFKKCSDRDVSQPHTEEKRSQTQPQCATLKLVVTVALLVNLTRACILQRQARTGFSSSNLRSPHGTPAQLITASASACPRPLLSYMINYHLPTVHDTTIVLADSLMKIHGGGHVPLFRNTGHVRHLRIVSTTKICDAAGELTTLLTLLAGGERVAVPFPNTPPLLSFRAERLIQIHVMSLRSWSAKYKCDTLWQRRICCSPADTCRSKP